MTQERQLDQPPRGRAAAARAHVLPFAAWLAAMCVPLPGATLRYALQTASGAALLCVLRPWRGYAPPRLRCCLAGLAAGVAVWALWIAPETAWMGARWPVVQGLYLRWAVRGTPSLEPGARFAPDAAGWAGTLLRAAGSAFVIAVIEEFFWRGFLYRRLAAETFMDVDPRILRPAIFAVVVCLFGIEHTRWLAGMLAGTVYGMLYVRTGDIWSAVTAHVATNLLLAVYVVRAGAYALW